MKEAVILLLAVEKPKVQPKKTPQKKEKKSGLLTVKNTSTVKGEGLTKQYGNRL